MNHFVKCCQEHRAVQGQCKCPGPKNVQEELTCKHGPLDDRSLFVNADGKVVRGNSD